MAELLTVEQASERLGLRRSKTYQIIMSGELRSVTIGRARRVPVRCIEQYIEGLITQQAGQSEQAS